MANVPETMPGLIDRFGRHVDDYRRGGYNETQVRREFIDALFAIIRHGVRGILSRCPR